jgi:hypothetical protein
MSQCDSFCSIRFSAATQTAERAEDLQRLRGLRREDRNEIERRLIVGGFLRGGRFRLNDIEHPVAEGA